jgi:chromosome partitioning protein
VTESSIKKPRILAIANQKGGVGKTTTAINLATAMAAVGKKILVVDLDPQGNASTGFGIPPEARDIGSYDVLIGSVSPAEAIRPSMVPGLSVMPATSDLAGAELELVDLERREFRLADALVDATALLDLDYVIIDAPPSLGLLTLNTLVAADAVLVPLQTEFFALEGLSNLMRTIDRVRERLNPRLTIQGVVLTMYDKRNNLSEAVAADVRAHLGALVYDTAIPRNVRISEAPSHGKPVLLYDLRCPGSQAYVMLASELLKREASLGAPVAA